MTRPYTLKSFRPPVDLRIDYAAELNAQQYQAVVAPPGPALVIAGAGAGKTRTLIYRVAYLIEQGIPRNRILLLTFTNKAAKEMMRRVADLTRDDCSDLWGGTFHSIGHRILRSHAAEVGYERNFTILDQEDASDLVKLCIPAAGIETTKSRFPSADVLSDIFSKAAGKQWSIPETLAAEYPYFENVGAEIARVHSYYLDTKRKRSVMDFDDLLGLWLKLLRDSPETLAALQSRFQFILVDEYQDTNQVQADIVDTLGAVHQNVMVVGDDSQSIYSWRGAEFKNILRFNERYPKAVIYKIETNYRSTPEILSLANAVIAHNLHQYHKELAPVRESGPKPCVAALNDASEQASYVAQRSLELRDEGISLNNIAVLYRSHFHAMELQLEFTRRNIPFQITSGIRFFEQAHIKDVCAVLKLICNPLDELAFKRLARMIRGVAEKTADKLWQAYHPHLMGAAAATSSSQTAALMGKGMSAAESFVPKKSAAGWQKLAHLLRETLLLQTEPLAQNAIKLILESGYREYVLKEYQNGRQRLDDIEQMAGFAAQFESVQDFVAQLALLTNIEEAAERPKDDTEPRIRLSTIHQAKGLEFDVVFMIMLCDGLFPSSRSIESPEAMEEERRLFYVAVTRARTELYLSYPAMRFMRGGSGDFMQQPSRFLTEIPEHLYDALVLKRQNTWY